MVIRSQKNKLGSSANNALKNFTNRLKEVSMTVASQSLRLAEIIFASKQNFRYVYTKGGFKICRKCCGLERARFAVDPIWIIKADNVNRNPVRIKCDHCGGFIEPKL
jgi:hypothetical protein